MKFRYVLKNKLSGEILFKNYSLLEIENGEVVSLNDCEIISRDRHTGLKDKNGVDIYEGDVLEYYNTYNRIELQKVLFEWYCTDNDGRCYENVMGWVDEDGYPIDTQENKHTIIGNIHEQK